MGSTSTSATTRYPTPSRQKSSAEWCRAATSSIPRGRTSTPRASWRTCAEGNRAGRRRRSRRGAPAPDPRPAPAAGSPRRHPETGGLGVAGAIRRQLAGAPALAMSVADKNLHLLVQRDDAARRDGAWRGRWSFRHACRADDAVPEGARRVRRSARRRHGRRLHAGSAAVRRCRGGGRQDADDPLRQHPRDGRMVGRGAAATPKIAALLALAAMPEPEPVPRVGIPSEGQLLIVGPPKRRCSGRSALARGSPSRCSSPVARSAPNLPAERDFPVFSGRLTRLDGWLGAFDARGRRKIRSTSTSARAATRA